MIILDIIIAINTIIFVLLTLDTLQLITAIFYTAGQYLSLILLLQNWINAYRNKEFYDLWYMLISTIQTHYNAIDSSDWVSWLKC